MSLDLDALEQLLPDIARVLGIPPEEAASALRGESSVSSLEHLDDVSALVQHSLCRLIGMEVEVP